MATDDKNIADKWYSSDVYKWKGSDKDKTFSIDTPPPTVSGQLHMGHVFSYTQADFIARYKRMKGLDVFYPIGFDDNGLPTERLTEKIIGKRAKDMPKDEFVNECKKVVVEAETEFEKLFKALGLSFDWDQKYQTISDESIAVAHSSFDDLNKKQLLYVADRPVYWCTVDQTALAQADIEDKEKESHEITFKCKIENEDFFIMTTRSELIPACVAVLYNPDDTRFAGKLEVKMPFIKHKVPLRPDEAVKIADEKYTGLVMCCAYGDLQDVKWIEKHHLEKQNVSFQIISKNGRIPKMLYDEIEGTNFEYQKEREFLNNLTEENSFNISQARKHVIDLLSEKNYITSIKTIKHPVKCAERSGVPVELIKVRQMYLNFGFLEPKFATSLGQIDQICNDKTLWLAKNFKPNLEKIVYCIDFKPSHLRQRLIDWINGLNQDWCISRDRFSGVLIPKTAQIEDGKVFDTWFTSSVSPQLNTGVINEAHGKLENITKHNKIFPMDLRPQAHEIIRTWTFYTIVKAYFHASEWDKENKNFVIKKRDENGNKTDENIDFDNTNKKELLDAKAIPWQTVALSGWCLASDKTKMSKSKGNIITPMSLIEEKGADIVRYWASCSHLGVDTHYNETKFVDGKKLINKLRNVAKFISPHLQGIIVSTPLQSIENKEITETSDLWILSKLQEVIAKVDQYFDDYNYCQARETAERFFWEILCDNYIEIVKSRVYGKDAYIYKYEKFKKTEQEIEKLKKSAVLTLCYVLNALLKMFAPIIPFVTEEIKEYIDLGCSNQKNQYSIHSRGDWIDEYIIEIDQESLEYGNYMLEIIEKVRKYKADQKISINSPVKIITLPYLPNRIESDLLSVINGLEAEINIGQDFYIEC